MTKEEIEKWNATKPAKYRDIIRKLNDMGKKHLPFDVMLKETLKTIVNTMHAEAGTLWFYDFYGSGKIYPKAVYGGCEIDDVTLDLGEGIAGSVIKSAKGVMISDCQKDERWSNKVDKQTGFITKSMICMPLGGNENIPAFATVQIINKEDDELFDELDFSFCTEVADLVTNFFIDRVTERVIGLGIEKKDEEEYLKDNYVLHSFGTRGTFPVNGSEYLEYGGATTCFILKKGTHAIVLDCGTGLYNAKKVLANCKKVDVLLTHMHYDHCMGLLTAVEVLPKNAEINFYGNFDAWFSKETINDFFRAPYWPVNTIKNLIENIVSVKENDEIDFGDGFVIKFIKSDHPNDSQSMFIKAGEYKICFMTDNEDNYVMPKEYLDHCDILVCDGMYDDAELESHKGWGHATWQSGVRVAKENHVGQLLITHHAPGANDTALRELEAKAYEEYNSTEFARCGSKIVL